MVCNVLCCCLSAVNLEIFSMGYSHYTGVNLGCNMIMVNFRGDVSPLSICHPFYGLSGAINSVYIMIFFF